MSSPKISERGLGDRIAQSAEFPAVKVIRPSGLAAPWQR